jgi:hypothetical protein
VWCVWVTGNAGKSRSGAGVCSFTVAASQRGHVLLSIASVLFLQICTLSSIMKKCPLETSFRNSSNVTGSVPPRSSTAAFQKLLPFKFLPKSCTSTRQRIAIAMVSMHAVVRKQLDASVCFSVF